MIKPRLISDESWLCRAAAVREELQAAVDQLPEGGPQEGEHLGGGGGDDHQAPRHPWQQVRLYQTLCSSPPNCLEFVCRLDLVLFLLFLHSKEFGSTEHMSHGVIVQSSCIRSSRKDSELSMVPFYR